MINALPTEIILKIFEYNDWPTTRSCLLTCKRFYGIIDSNMKRIKPLPCYELSLTSLYAGIQIFVEINKKNCYESISSTIDLFNYIWFLRPNFLKINQAHFHLRKVLELVPDWWFEGIQELDVFEQQSDSDVLSLLSRMQFCRKLSVVPADTVNYHNDLLNRMKSVNEFRVCKSRTIHSDDSMLQLLIEKSINDHEGLAKLQLEDACQEYSIEVFMNFLMNAKFAPNVHISFDNLRGTKARLLELLIDANATLQDDFAHKDTISFLFRESSFQLDIKHYIADI